MAQLTGDALRLKAGHNADAADRPLTGINLNDYLKRIAAPMSLRDLCRAWWTVSGNGDPARIPASELLSSCGYGDGTPDSMIDVWADTLTGGVSLLAERMIAASGAQVVMNTAVSRIKHRGEEVIVTGQSGAKWRAHAAVLATGLNPLRAITFDPGLPTPQTMALSIGHLGASVKIWAKVRGAPVGVLATGGGESAKAGIEWMFSERLAADGATLIAGFGLAAKFDPARPGAVAREVARFFPEAELLAYDWHDWVGDPFARGTWVATPLGAERAVAAATWRGTGPLGLRFVRHRGRLGRLVRRRDGVRPGRGRCAHALRESALVPDDRLRPVDGRSAPWSGGVGGGPFRRVSWIALSRNAAGTLTSSCWSSWPRAARSRSSFSHSASAAALSAAGPLPYGSASILSATSGSFWPLSAASSWYGPEGPYDIPWPPPPAHASRTEKLESSLQV